MKCTFVVVDILDPNKFNSARLDQSSSRNRATGPQPRIVEVKGDEGNNTAGDSTSPQPIVEEPDDPPTIRRSPSDPNDYFPPHPHPHPHPFFFQPPPPVMTMSAGSAAAYFQQQQQQPGFPNANMFAPHHPHHHHPHVHMHQPHFMHPHFLHQYHPLMSARGILIEIIDEADPHNQPPHGVNGPMDDAQDSLYMVTVNGQRYVMSEDQVRQLVTEVHQRQSYQENLQQHQQQQQQQQRFFQQQQAQQRPFPEQQYFA